MTILHVTSEYQPWAQTGGLAGAVRGLADHQHRTGRRVATLVPLYQTIRDKVPGLEPAMAPVEVPLAGQLIRCRVLRPPQGPDEAPVLFLEHQGAYERGGIYGDAGGDYGDNGVRFALLARAAVEVMRRLADEPGILHAHDWHAALALLYLRTVVAHEPWTRRVGAVLNVHNAGYQGHFPSSLMPALGLPWSLYRWDVLEWYGRVNFLQGGLAAADMAVTVSPSHAEELRTPDGGFGLQGKFAWMGGRLVGIRNGIDQGRWDPVRDAYLSAPFGPDDIEGKWRCKVDLQRRAQLPTRGDVPLFAFSARMVMQKGLDLMLQAPALLHRDAQFLFLGGGERRYTDQLVALSRAFPDRVSVRFEYAEEREHRLLAGADMLLMPSQYEPCGLTQMKAQRYGTLPVARRTGGLGDTIDDGQTGFLFGPYHPLALEQTIDRALGAFHHRDHWTWMMRQAMRRDFGWDAPANDYDDVYREALSRAARG